MKKFIISFAGFRNHGLLGAELWSTDMASNTYRSKADPGTQVGAILHQIYLSIMDL